MTTSRSARDDVSRSTTVAGSPVSAAASSPRSRSSPTRAGTAARPRRSAPAAGGGAARSQHGSRTRRGRRAPRRRRRRRGSRGRLPSGRGAEDADVEHVRVREDEVRPLADLPAPLAGGVAVVDRRPEPLQSECRECPSLILRERLGGVEVEGPRLGLARDRVEHGKVEGERLSGRGARRDDDVLAAAGRLPGLCLVAVEGGDTVRGERGGDARIEVVGKRLEPRLARRLDPACTRSPRRRAGPPSRSRPRWPCDQCRSRSTVSSVVPGRTGSCDALEASSRHARREPRS